MGRFNEQRRSNIEKTILLAFVIILSTNIIFSVDGTPTSIKEPLQIQRWEEKSLAQI